jgi:hypothetical protein
MVSRNNGEDFIVFDESFDSDTQHGGGQVALIIVGRKVKGVISPQRSTSTRVRASSCCKAWL